MDNPIKIIHKFKNNNRRIQYSTYIFIGDVIDDSIMRILKKIKELDLYQTLTKLNEKDYEALAKYYGEQWYTYFFNTYHIEFIIENILTTPEKIRELKNIHGLEWYNFHIGQYEKRKQSIIYSYETMIKDERERKIVKKNIQSQLQQDIEDTLDYTTNTGISYDFDRVNPILDHNEYNIYGDQNKPYKIVDTSGNQSWCTDDDVDDQVGAADDDEFDNIDTSILSVTEDIDSDDPMLDAFDAEIEKDNNELDNIFGELENTDKNIKVTTKEIKDAISKELYQDINKKIAEFDTEKDSNMFDENLKDVYDKIYITSQYIYTDDTIKIIRHKICAGIKNNPKFGPESYIIPSYQYLWSEYKYNSKMEKIMIGQKWIVKNDLLKLDIEPNNIIVYEELRGNLKMLRDNIRRQGKIKREDDENNILTDYTGYFTNNEIFMCDIYNELGLNYNPSIEELKNLSEVYLKIYFPYVKLDDFDDIITNLNTSIADNKKTIERTKVKNIFETITNDLILENEIMRDLEIVKKKNHKEYSKIFKENYVVQSFIRSYLLERGKKIDLYRIFDNFTLDEEYPFIQFQTSDGNSKYKYAEEHLFKHVSKNIIMKWFETSPYGISFKVRVKDHGEYKYMAINLSDNGRIDYKIQWKEEDMCTIDDINLTYKYIRKLVEKLNNENAKNNIVFKNPTDSDFDYAFINTIQKFELPNNFSINHNDLSEFSRYFFPYVALVIEPRKRLAKSSATVVEEKSKYGTYLRYKRVSKYENKTKIEHRIVFFMRNYEYDDQSLSAEISKEFNITEEQAMIEIQSVREKYPNMKKSRRILKKLENIPKYKPPGIGIDIQGKSRTNYKMRIAGARDKVQLNRIINFMNILIYLYVETYLYNKPERKRMKDKLIRLTNIAKRRNKVEEIVDYDKASDSSQNIKQMIAIDSKRLGEKGDEDNQYSRDCQNSGNDKKRRPIGLLSIDKLQELGYTWREELDGKPYGHYAKTIFVDADGKTESKKKKTEVVLRAIQLPLDETGENFVYYTCSPEENGKHMYVGFLGKSKNPYGDARPCCFIKDQLYSKNDEKRQLYLKSIGLLEKDDQVNQISGDQLYILQDSNKIQEGRFAFLPKYLDVFMNFMLGNQRIIENHYLSSSPTGYYFKYGSKQDEFRYLNAIGSVLDMTVDDIRNKMIHALKNDRCQSIFTSLNNGDIRTQFGTIDSFITYLSSNEYLDYKYVNDLLSIPGVITPTGINILIFRKKTQIIRKTFEKEKLKENYYVICNNKENIEDVTDPVRKTIFIMKESKSYYPIIMVKKNNPDDREIHLTKTFNYENINKNLVKHIYEYYKINCRSEFNILIKERGINTLNAKQMYSALSSIGKKEHVPKTQIVDTRFKCKYLVTNSGYLIPVSPSGCIYSIGITSNIDNYTKDFNDTVNYLKQFPVSLGLVPIGLFYNEKKEKTYNVTSLLLESYQSMPIIHRSFTKDSIKKLGLSIQSKPDDEVIDKEIVKGSKNIEIDDRIMSVMKNKYEIETYQLFRFHLSYFLNNTDVGKSYKEKLETAISSNKLDKNKKKLLIKKILYHATDKGLSHKFNDLLKSIQTQSQSQSGGSDNEKYWIKTSNKKFDYPSFVLKNNRELCYSYNSKDMCNTQQHCSWNGSRDICLLNVAEDLVINYINQVSEELLQNELKAQEIFRRDKYFVSDIVNYSVFTERPGEKIILSTNVNLGQILGDIFGKENIPRIGRRKNKIESMQNYDQLNYEHPMKESSTYYSQQIIENNNSVYRAFANGYYWLLHPFADSVVRNLGYYSSLQTKLSSQYKSEVIDWITTLLEPENANYLSQIKSYFKYQNLTDNIVRMSNDVQTLTNCVIELFVLSKLYETIIYVYDDNMTIIYMIHPTDGIVYDKNTNTELNNSKYTSYTKVINMKFYFFTKNIYPDKIESIYFK